MPELQYMHECVWLLLGLPSRMSGLQPESICLTCMFACRMAMTTLISPSRPSLMITSTIMPRHFANKKMQMIYLSRDCTVTHHLWLCCVHGILRWCCIKQPCCLQCKCCHTLPISLADAICLFSTLVLLLPLCESSIPSKVESSTGTTT